MKIFSWRTGAMLWSGESLSGAYLGGADLSYADLRDAHLSGAYLRGADLVMANLVGADLRYANLGGADLSYADLRGADLRYASLREANLLGATMPDGRRWEEYRLDHMAGVCDEPIIRDKAISAWGNHSWNDCPMHCAFGISESRDELMSCWVALYDGGLLDKPMRDGKDK